MRLAIVTNKIDGGGVGTALASLLYELAKDNTLSIDLFVFGRTNESRFHIPDNINRIYPSKILDLWFESKGKSRGFRKLEWLLVKGFGLKLSMRPIELTSVRGQIYGDYDVGISYVNDIADPDINFMANDFVLHRIKADKYISWIHNDAYKLGFTNNYCLNRYRDFDLIVNVSAGNKAKFDEICPEYMHKSVVIYNCVNLEEKCEVEYKWNKDGRFHIISVSRLANKQKRIDRMIDVCAELNRRGYQDMYVWHMFGSGSDEGMLKTYANEKGVYDNFVFEGQTLEPLNEMSKADIYVMTSDYEGYGLTILEALLQELPVLVTNFPEAKESVRNGENGYITDFDVDDITNKIIMLMSDDQIYSKTVENIRKNPVTNAIALRQFYNLILNIERK